MLTYHQWGPVTITWGQLPRRYLSHQLVILAQKLLNKKIPQNFPGARVNIIPGGEVVRASAAMILIYCTHSISQPPVHQCFAWAIELNAHPKITIFFHFHGECKGLPPCLNYKWVINSWSNCSLPCAWGCRIFMTIENTVSVKLSSPSLRLYIGHWQFFSARLARRVMTSYICTSSYLWQQLWGQLWVWYLYTHIFSD